ncbi:unnamed protein product [Owenia fusiformis]|uniref:Strictosidine synthase conserved region domain-containing protein n=1 Tax=Owenia fusiformis TaxID=6347 RepID=A0A8S4PDY6_OWEFU|nr:unnamed protein product [Owenia fusiformis]
MSGNVRQRKGDKSSNLKEFQNENIETKQKKGTSFCPRLCLFLVTSTILMSVGLVIAALVLPSPITPRPYSLPSPPPKLEGPLAPNTRLQDATRLFENEILGPESIFVNKEYIYTGTADGRVVEIFKGKQRTLARLGNPPCGGPENEPHCGRPLGMKMDKDGYLIVADAYFGLFKVNVATGDFTVLYNSTSTPISSHFIRLMNDLDIHSDGTIYLSSSSSKFYRREFPYIMLEGQPEGGIYAFDPVTSHMTQLLGGLYFANGVTLTKDGKYLLIVETVKCRILKYHLSGIESGKLEIFADNLPGVPDNIRRSSKGGYWVAMAAVRHQGMFNPVDFLAENPWFRNLIAKFILKSLMTRFFSAILPEYGLILELDGQGKIVQSLHDPSGKVVPSVSEVEESGPFLYLGSYALPYFTKLLKK